MLAGRSRNVTALVAESKDAIERKGVDWAAGDSDARYRLLADNLSDVIWTMDTNLKYTYISPSVTRLRGYSVEEAMALSMEETITPAFFETAMRVMAEAEAKQQSGPDGWPTSVTLETELTCKDGSTVWVENRVTYLRDGEGRLTGYLGVSRDIGERRKAQAALVENEKRYRLLVENAGEGILVIQDGLVKFANRKTLDIFDNLGHAEQQVMSQPFTDFVHPEDRRTFVENSTRCLAGEEHDRSCLFRAIGNGDEIRWLQLNGVHLEWEGKPGGLIFLTDVTERKRVEEALKTSEERFRTLIEHASDAIAILDDKGTIVYESPSAERILGYDPRQLIGVSFPDLVHPEDIERVVSVFASVMESPGKIVDCQLRIKHKDGSWREMEGKAQNLLHDPKVKGIIVNYRDITERKKVEEALRISEESYRSLVENTSDLIYVADAKGIITYMGPQITRYGFSPEEAVSRSLFGFVAPEDQERQAVEYMRTIKTGERFPSEFRMVDRDGHRHWLEDFGKPLHDDSGNVIGVSGVLRDVTDRKKAQESLREQEDKYSTLVNRAGDAIGIIQDGKWAYVNPTGAKMFGYAMEEVAGKPFTDIISPASLDTVVQSYRTRLTGTEGLAPYEVMAQRKDGTPLAVEVSGAPIQYHGRPAVMAIARDITERKKAEEAVRESEARYRLLAENSSDVIWTMDTNLRYTYMSPSVTSLRGYSVEEAMALSMEETTTPTSLQTALRIMAKAEAQEGQGPEGRPSSVTLELELTCKDGSTVWVENRITYLRDAEGRLTGYQGVSRDITERKQAEKEIRILSSVVEQSTEGMAIAGLDGILTFVNEAWCRMHGYNNPKELLGKNLAVFHNEEQLENDVKPLNEKVIELGAHSREVGHVTRDGRPFPTLMTTTLLKDNQGKPYALAGIAKDITEQKQVEERARERVKELGAFYSLAEITEREGITLDQVFQEFANTLPKSWRYTAIACARIVICDSEFRTENFAESAWRQSAPIKVNTSVVGKIEVGYLEERPELDEGPFLKEERLLIDALAERIGRMTERKKAEEELRASDKRFKTLFEASMDATMLLSPERRFFKGNPATVEMFGCKDEAEFTTKTPAELSPENQPDGRPSMAKAQEMIAIAMEKGSHFFEWSHKRLDGREFFADVLLARMEWEGETVLQATVRDVSERRKAEEALKTREEFYSRILGQVEVAICIIGVDGRVVYQSAAGERLWGPVSETGGAIGFDIINPDDLPQVMTKFAEVLEGKDDNVTLECRIKHPDGTYHWCSTTGTNCLNDPVVKGLIIVTTDINERKKVEEAIAESEKRYRLLAENASDVITVVGMDFKPKYMSPSTTRLLGYTVEEAMANGMENGLTPASLQIAAEAFGKAIVEEQKGQKQKPMAIDLEFNRKDGSTVWVATSVSFIRDSEGKPVEILSNLHDITERKRAQEEMESAKEIAEAANRAKSDFLASMSHEIRTPMNGVVGMTGLLADTPLNPEQRDYVESIKSSAEALMTIINDILDFSKVEAGKLNLEKMDFDLRSTMENMSDVLAVRAREKGLEYVWLLEPNVPTRLVGDPGRLRQILINLLGNAVKFTPKGNVDLRISLVSESDTEAVVQFDVRDTGIGIANEKLGSLFKPFTQVDTSTTRKYGGTGLGLSISKRMVELMGGQLGVESREGMGSTFWFTARLGKQSGERKSQELPLGLSGLRVLGVDDNPTNRKVLEHMLQSWGCRVELVENAAMAMARLHAAVVSGDPFRVAIVDIMMPEVDGETLGRMVKATPQLKDTVLIASSSSGGRDDAARLGIVGFAHYLTKPVKQSQLFNAIASCVAREGEKTTAATGAAAPSCTAVAETSQEQQKARILLAEDNAVNQKVAIAMLRKMGYSHVDVVASGVEALKALEKIPYDLVLMDVHMPEMDGLEATRRIRDAKSTVRNHLVPVVAMTASAMKGDREMCLDAGMNDYISKPINRAELVRALGQWAAPRPGEKTSPPEAEASPSAKVFDKPSLLERVGDDEEICAEILKSFVEDVPERIKEMENSLVQGDNETLKRGAHTVKGAAGNVSALMLREAAGHLEAAVAAGELGSAREMLDAIAAEFGKFKKAIGQS